MFNSTIHFSELFDPTDFIFGDLETLKQLESKYGWEFRDEIEAIEEAGTEPTFRFYFDGTTDSNENLPDKNMYDTWVDWSGYHVDSSDHAQAWVELLEVAGVKMLREGLRNQ